MATVATAVAGHTGSVRIVGTPVTTVAFVDQWTGTLTTEMYDSSALGDQWLSNTPGRNSLTGTINGSWDVASDPGQTTLNNASFSGATVSLDLYADGNSNGYEGTFLIDSFQTTVPKGGLVTFSANIRSQGQVYFI